MNKKLLSNHQTVDNYSGCTGTRCRPLSTLYSCVKLCDGETDVFVVNVIETPSVTWVEQWSLPTMVNTLELQVSSRPMTMPRHC